MYRHPHNITSDLRTITITALYLPNYKWVKKQTAVHDSRLMNWQCRTLCTVSTVLKPRGQFIQNCPYFIQRDDSGRSVIVKGAWDGQQWKAMICKIASCSYKVASFVESWDSFSGILLTSRVKNKSVDNRMGWRRETLKEIMQVWDITVKLS